MNTQNTSEIHGSTRNIHVVSKHLDVENLMLEIRKCPEKYLFYGITVRCQTLKVVYSRCCGSLKVRYEKA